MFGIIQLFLCILSSGAAFRLNSMHASTLKQSSSLNMVFNIFNQGQKSSSSSIPSNKKICVITGTSSGLGKETAKKLLSTNDYFVICACRDVEKMKSVAKKEGFDEKNHLVMELDLSSYDSVRKFASNLKAVKSRPLDRLVCNAAVYQPALSVVSNLIKHI